MKIRDKIILFLGTGFLFWGVGGNSNGWASYPEKPINGIMPYAAGGAPDLLFRPLLEASRKYLGVPVVVLNKPAGGGTAGTAEVAQAKPDGYTLLLNFGGGEQLVSPHLQKLPFDTLKDFEPVIMLSYFPSGIFVREEAPWQTLEQFIAEAKKEPGKIRFAHTGAGTVNHLTALSLEKMAGIGMSGIPTGGGGQAINMLLGGHVEAAQVGVPVAWPQVAAKKIRCLAYSLPKKSEAYPGAPTYVEKGFDIRTAINQGIAAPKGTPKEIIKKLHDAFAASFKEKGTQEVMEKIRFAPHYLNSEETAKYIAEMYQYYGEMIKKLGVTLKK